MNWYEKISKDIRKEKSKLTEQQLNQLKTIYKNTLSNISEDIRSTGNNELKERWLKDYEKQLKKYLKHLNNELNNNTKDGLIKASQMGISVNEKINEKIFKTAGIDMGNHFKSMFSSVQDNVIKDIISGNLYKDKKSLSNRIWNFTNQNGKDIQSIITEGIAQKKSAVAVAKDLEEFVKPASKRLTDWGKCYPNLRSREVDYGAMRLARTSINHAYQNATIQGSQDNPYIDGILWESAEIHGRTCELCLERDGKVFPKDDVPLDHPNGLCTMIPCVTKDLEDIGKEIRDWINGEENESLDNWYGNNVDNVEKRGYNKDELMFGDGIERSFKDFLKFSNYSEFIEFYGENKIEKFEWSVTNEEAESIAYYSHIGDKHINAELRSGILSKEIKKDVTNIDNVISKFILPGNISVYRGSDIDFLYKEFDTDDIKEFVGKSYKDNGYVSTSIIAEKAFDHKDAMFEILVPQSEGIGAIISGFSRHFDEQEFLLKRNLEFKVVDIKNWYSEKYNKNMPLIIMEVKDV